MTGAERNRRYLARIASGQSGNADSVVTTELRLARERILELEIELQRERDQHRRNYEAGARAWMREKQLEAELAQSDPSRTKAADPLQAWHAARDGRRGRYLLSGLCDGRGRTRALAIYVYVVLIQLGIAIWPTDDRFSARMWFSVLVGAAVPALFHPEAIAWVKRQRRRVGW